MRFNAEMILLPHEMFRHRGSTMMARVGTPIPPAELVHTSTELRACQIRSLVYSLADKRGSGADLTTTSPFARFRRQPARWERETDSGGPPSSSNSVALG